MLKVVDDTPLLLSSGHEVRVSDVVRAAEAANVRLAELARLGSEMEFTLFNILDFRMLSGLVGETLVGFLAENLPALEKNPNIDGYPDLVDISQRKFQERFHHWSSSDPAAFVAYEFGGIEVKNTFGVKKARVGLIPGQQRIGNINTKLDWKAHHRTTNYLLATLTDFVDGQPQVVAGMFSNQLTESDWTLKAQPKATSTMTSFSVVTSAGSAKIREGLRFCIDRPEYERFLASE